MAEECLSWGRYPAVKHHAIYRANWTDQVPASSTGLHQNRCCRMDWAEAMAIPASMTGRDLV